MVEEFTARVEQSHINKGAKESSSCCPIALALNEATGKVCNVGRTMVWVDCCKYWLDDPGKQFVWSFDNMLPVKPFTVKLTRVKP